MPKNQLKKMDEREEHIQAFNLYYDLGPNRSLNEVAKRLKKTRSVIQAWCKVFGWDDRVEQLRLQSSDGSAVSVGEFLEKEQVEKYTPATMEQELLLVQIERLKKLIDGCFEKDGDGTEHPRFEITSLEGFSKVVKEYRDCIETYHKISMSRKVASPEEAKRKKVADNVNFIFNKVGTDELPMEALLEFINGNDQGDGSRGHRPIEGRDTEADFSEVSDEGCEE